MKNQGFIYLKGGFFCLVWLLTMVLAACVQEDRFGNAFDCDQRVTANISLAEFKGLYQGTTRKIMEELTVEAYVISSDHQGNFYGILHVQDHPTNPREGMEILMDFQDSHLFDPTVTKILINAKGLYLGKSKGHIQLGSAYQLFGQEMVGRIPSNQVRNHLLQYCGELTQARPKGITLAQIDDQKPSTWVVLDSLQFFEDELGLTYAEAKEDARRILEDCNGNTLALETSGYSDFYDHPLPVKRGRITGVLVADKTGLALIAAGPEDAQMTGERCEKAPPPVSSDKVFISEIADPDNNNKARFIELYNAGDQTLSLNGWVLERYTNDNVEVGSSIDLSGLEIAPGKAITISADAKVFEEVYGFTPNLEGGLNSAADSNGDDNLVLRDPFAEVIDIFGRIGEDGTGTDHEFEDGRALRLPGISLGSPVYTSEEWILYNDTGSAGTINQPQMAPQDFTPGEH